MMLMNPFNESISFSSRRFDIMLQRLDADTKRIKIGLKLSDQLSLLFNGTHMLSLCAAQCRYSEVPPNLDSLVDR